MKISRLRAAAPIQDHSLNVSLHSEFAAKTVIISHILKKKNWHMLSLYKGLMQALVF